MIYNELIDALRNCKGVYPDASCDKCLYDKHPYCMADMHHDAADAIERLQAQVPRWIPVTERLPERADEVLIAYREEYDDWTEEYAVSTATYMPRAGRWDYDHLKITHWMPLPEPPDLT